ncbi:MAG: CBS domain-containing protein [Thermodesulfobacteriota bacterium]
MKEKKVKDILLPFKEGTPLSPSVTLNDKIIHAIELMVNNNLKCITVTENQGPVGMVCLKDALQEMGLKVTDK